MKNIEIALQEIKIIVKTFRKDYLSVRRDILLFGVCVCVCVVVCVSYVCEGIHNNLIAPMS